MKKSGYTLVELLAVLVILGMLVVIVGSLVNKTIDQTKDTVKKTQEQSVLNAAEKWSIDYSEEFDDMDSVRIELGIDVVFVLDISTSMFEIVPNSPPMNGYENTKRNAAMVQAFNGAMEALEGDNNRQAVMMYGGSTVEFLPLANYTSPSKIYMEQARPNRSNSNNPYQTTSDLRKNGVVINPKKQQESISGTYTQGGIIDGAQILLNVPAAETAGRIPVVILLTDGEPTISSASRCETCSASHQQQLGFSDSNYYYALMAGYESVSKIKEHYRGNDVYFYTIAFGVRESEQIKKMLNPGAYASTQSNNYVTRAFLDEQMSVADLKLIFENVASEVVAASKVTQVCVTVQELYDLGYLNKDDIEFDSGDMSNNFVIVSYNEATNQFKYVLTKTEAQRDTCMALRTS